MEDKLKQRKNKSKTGGKGGAWQKKNKTETRRYRTVWQESIRLGALHEKEEHFLTLATSYQLALRNRI